jgi:uncharacterized protein YuzE
VRGKLSLALYSSQETTVTTEELAEGIAAGYDAQRRLVEIEILDAAQRLGSRKALSQVSLEGVGQAMPA